MKKAYGRHSHKTHKKVDLKLLLEQPTNKQSSKQAEGIEFSDSDTNAIDKSPALYHDDSPTANNTETSFLSSAFNSMSSDPGNKALELKSGVPDAKKTSDPLNGLLDFLTVPKCKRKSKRIKPNPFHHSEQFSENNGFDFKEALTDVNTFVESLQQPDEFNDSENKVQKEAQIPGQVTKCLIFNDESQLKKNVYGSYRSMLRSSVEYVVDDDDSDKLSRQNAEVKITPIQDDVGSLAKEDESSADEAGETNENVPLTQNFNQLKAMGSNIQYNDDIRFVMEGSLPAVKKFITMIQEVRSSEGLRNYIANYYTDEFWDLLQNNADDPYLLMVLSTLGRMHSKLAIGHFVQLSRYTPRNDLGKHYQTQYEEIFKVFGNHTTLGVKTLNSLKEKKQAIIEDPRITDYLARIPFCPEIISLLPFVDLDKNAKSFWKLTTNINIQNNIENADYIKSCVSLTNTRNFDTRNVTNLLNFSLQYILTNFQDTDKQHLLILHLGLCSNILHLHKKKVLKVSYDLSPIYENLDMAKLDFVHNLFLLNYAYLLKFAGKEIDTSITKSLLCWATNIDDLNNSFKERADYILNS